LSRPLKVDAPSECVDTVVFLKIFAGKSNKVRQHRNGRLSWPRPPYGTFFNPIPAITRYGFCAALVGTIGAGRDRNRTVKDKLELVLILLALVAVGVLLSQVRHPHDKTPLAAFAFAAFLSGCWYST
jgi:hypothetical protein